MFKYLIDWPFLAILVTFNMVRISGQVYMILYKQGVSHEPQQVWRRDTKCPFIKQNVLAIIIIGGRAAKQILPLWHVWGSIHCRWGFCPWDPHSGGDWQNVLYFCKRKKLSIVIPFFTQSCLRSCFELGGGYLMAAGPFEIYCSIASTKIVVRISNRERIAIYVDFHRQYICSDQHTCVPLWTKGSLHWQWVEFI